MPVDLSKMTKGPWQHIRNKGQSNWPGRGFSEVVETATEVPILANGETPDEARANATVVAAAYLIPELRDALQGLCDTASPYGDGRQLRAANEVLARLNKTLEGE